MRQRPQLNLSHLFLATTVVCGLSFLARLFGVVFIFPVLAGLYIWFCSWTSEPR